METNQERYPYTEKADLKITKTFNFSEKISIRFFANINNIFDKRNYLFIYPRTGEPFDDGAYYFDEDYGYYVDKDGDYVSDSTIFLHDLSYHPGNVSTGRKITVGMSFNW